MQPGPTAIQQWLHVQLKELWWHEVVLATYKVL